jgi:hypothetical protein
MRNLLTVIATAAIFMGCGLIWKAEAATMADVGRRVPITKSYASVEKVAYWRRQYRRAYRRGSYSYGYPGYAYPASPYYGDAYRAYPYSGSGYRVYEIGPPSGPRLGWRH